MLDRHAGDGVSGRAAADLAAWPHARIEAVAGFFVHQPLTVFTSKGQVYYTIEHSTAENNSWSGFQIEDNTPTSLYQANVFGNTAKDNGSGFPSGEPEFGWGFYATQPVKGNKTNGAAGNQNGNCHDVPCHKL